MFDAPAAAGWRAELDLTFAPLNGRTTLVHRHHHGPLRVQRPFYPEQAVCHVYVVHPPGGIVGGDQLAIRVRAEPGSQTLLTTPAAGKFYRSGGSEAAQSVALQLQQAALEWLPQETIYYAGARARQRTVVTLDANSRFIGWELGCFGLSTRDEPFDAGRLRQDFEVWLGERPLLLDHLRLAGGEPTMTARWGLNQQTVLGTFVAYPATRDDLETLRELPAGQGDDIGLTIVDDLLVVRCAGRHADAVMRRFVALWQALRPRLLGRPAVPPRIWAT